MLSFDSGGFFEDRMKLGRFFGIFEEGHEGKRVGGDGEARGKQFGESGGDYFPGEEHMKSTQLF